MKITSKSIINTISKRIRVALLGNTEVKVSIVLDKNNPTNLEKAYLLISTRDILSTNKRWRIAYRSKQNSISMFACPTLDFSNIIPKRTVKYRLGLEFGTEEYKRFDKFACSKGIFYKQVQDSLRDASIKTSIRYLNMVNRKDMTTFVV
ncbi:MAG: hypothetical protein ACRCX8_04730 [Sarcina sp.]